MEMAIVTEDLTKTYADVLALDRLNLRVPQGEIFGFLGPNGAGKTTTIRLLLDLIRPSAGRASVLGFDCQQQSLEARSRIGYLPGDLRLYPGLHGHDMLDLVAHLRATPVDRRYVQRLVDRLELDLRPRIATYSKGTRQKLGVVLALLARPPVLLLDEPTSGLDPLMQHAVWDILREEAERGTTVFFSTHVLSEAALICQRVGILGAGRLIAVEPIAQLQRRALRRLVVTFAGTVPELGALPGVRLVARAEHQLTLETPDDIDPLVKRLAGFHVCDLRTEQPDLDDILLGYYPESRTP
ncbi:MAG TPA: ABC transporter ATP-binding protein [Nitrolancea sp.]|nr:ABC transporter ATP-binding protein [Nitrolancea sp.]